MTFIGQRLDDILRPYLKIYETKPQTTKPLNIIVITDGAASDDVEAVIVQHARKLDSLEACPWQIGIQMFQVGDDPKAKAMLDDLDDGLEYRAGVRDMVDTVAYKDGMEFDAKMILMVLLGSVNRRLDRKDV